jgi:hypothetical protein
MNPGTLWQKGYVMLCFRVQKGLGSTCCITHTWLISKLDPLKYICEKPCQPE